MACPNDRAVLEALFNPLFAEVPTEIDPKDVEEENPWTPSTEETRAVAFAEAGKYYESLQLLNDLLTRSPSDIERASLLNNRAQVNRLMGDIKGATKDLDEVIALNVNRKALRQSLAQKALLERLAGRREEGDKLLEKAAALGSRFARAHLESEPTNPYAKLCNQMVKKMFEDLRAEYNR